MSTLDCVYRRKGVYTRLCVCKERCLRWIVCMEGKVCTLDCVYGRKGEYTRVCVWKEG